jgi:hypothetical protein
MLTESTFLVLVVVVLLLLAPVLGTWAYIRIRRSKGHLKGKTVALMAMSTLVPYALLAFLVLISKGQAFREVCGAHLKGLGMGIHVYAQNNSGKYPTVGEWCDLLIQHAGVRPKSFVCAGSGSRLGESSYAINKHVAGKKVSDVAGDVVLLFETNFGKAPTGRNGFLRNRKSYKSGDGRGNRDDRRFGGPADNSTKVYELRWNQSGGAELLTTENHKGEGCNILFNDRSVKFVRADQLSELRWK